MKKYDVIFVGTGIVPILEAIYLNSIGKSVLMIDDQADVGGAWAPIELFDIKNVENAIHYFMPDPHAFNFMNDILGWNVIESEKKYRLLNMPFEKYWKLPYDNNFGRLLSHLMKTISSKDDSWKKIIGILNDIKEVTFGFKQKSYYVEGGTAEIIFKVKKMLSSSNVELEKSSHIKKFFIDKESKDVKVYTSDKTFISNSVCFTHGSRISELSSTSGEFPINEKELLRPAMHMLVQDKSPSKILECIFTEDPVIKYIHDITKYTNKAKEFLGEKKLFVLALQADVRENEDIYDAVFNKMKKVGLVGEHSILEQKCWWDIYLPRLFDEDLQTIKDEFGQQVTILKTENTSRSIGIYSKRWQPIFSSFNTSFKYEN